jgi:glycine/D-amino acid oxidase-like deaminating enzyme
MIHDAVVIGGGFYGSAIALYLARQRAFRDVLLIEQGETLLGRASYNNQARIHNGYHYPRSLTTAFRSRVNLPCFVEAHRAAVKSDFTHLYAVSRRNSKTSAKQFVRFCRDIGARLSRAPAALQGLFDARLIEEVFVVEGCLTLECAVKGHSPRLLLSARYVFNCTYSGLNGLGGDFPRNQARLKHEITEMALIRPPGALRELGVTVMDGPFFSMMPFPAKGLHSLSHVRYTPHTHWIDEPQTDPYGRLARHARETRVERMLRDAARYLPAIRGSEHVDSLFEVKTVLMKNEVDDGRPILFERHAQLPNCFSILGGKIDNVYDVLARLEAEPLMAA